MGVDKEFSDSKSYYCVGGRKKGHIPGGKKGYALPRDIFIRWSFNNLILSEVPEQNTA